MQGDQIAFEDAGGSSSSSSSSSSVTSLGSEQAVAITPDVPFAKEEHHGAIWLRLPHANDDKKFFLVHCEYFKFLFPDKDLSDRKVCASILKEIPIIRWAPNRRRLYTRHGIPMATTEDGITDGEILSPFPACQKYFITFFEEKKKKVSRGHRKTTIRGMRVVRHRGPSETESEPEVESPPAVKKKKKEKHRTSVSASSKKRKKISDSSDSQDSSEEDSDLKKYTDFLSGLIGSVGRVPEKEMDAVASFAEKSYFKFQQRAAKKVRKV